MTSKRASRDRKTYYKPPSTLAKIRHRLADGTPAHALLHYLHGRKKLPKDVRIIAEAAEKLHQVRELLAEVQKDGGIDEVSNVIPSKFQKLKALVSGEAAALIKSFMSVARKALIVKTMKEPDE